jgi:hypothetical protein
MEVTLLSVSSAIQQGDHVRDTPHVIADAGFHRRSHSQALMNAAKIVVHIVNRYRVAMIHYFPR